MNNNVVPWNQNPAQTMSSQEIADLVEARHDSVKRTIERLANQGVIVQPPLVNERGEDAIGRPRVTQVYLFAGERGKRDSIVVVAQLSPQFTARLVDRWQELENGATALPKTLPEALRLAADMAEQKAAAEAALAIAAPKADALDMISAGEKAVTITQAAKILGIKRLTLTNWLHVNGWIYRQNGTWVAYDQHIKNGRLQFKEARYTDQTTGQECFSPYCHILPKGLALLAVHFGREAA